MYILALALGLVVSQASAEELDIHPLRVNLATTGSLSTGNLAQAQVMGSGQLSQSGERLGYDLLGSVFRMWVRPAPDDPLLPIGDTLALTALPFAYVSERVFVLGTARYEHTQLRQISGRVNGGAAVGYTPIRQADRLLRAALGAQLERTGFASAALDPAWVDDADARLVPRLTLQSNGWLRPKGSRLSGRFVGGVLVNPVLPRDVRAYLDVATDLAIAGPLSARLAVNLLHDTVLPVDVRQTDTRATLGLAWRSPAPQSPAE